MDDKRKKGSKLPKQKGPTGYCPKATTVKGIGPLGQITGIGIPDPKSK